MEEIKLDVQSRKEIGGQRIRQVRRNGFVPAIIYGKEAEPVAVKLEKKAFERIRRAHIGESVVYHLNIFEGETRLSDCSAIVKEEQHNPVTDEIIHVDFNVISLTQEIEVKVGLVMKGDAPGVKKSRGSIEHHIWDLEVICLPMNIPQHIDVDISALEIGDSIYVKDIVLPDGVKTKEAPEAVVCTVIPPMREEEPGAAVEGPTEPEVIKEKKAEAPEAKDKDSDKK
ncbi:MAG TPA: 50S ribosomal protein L25 [Candidatus Omnitrophota bacterium]|nr:50S ribosomal protein L25 [Candidatus Omnitrophota bacterium]HQO57233.1 50S ribosomal protein L25 [Candidatus Omnitrophota bacterium]HQP13030.1 50S ribosomal protein L25 [Candidatus Omnitrophota bacterium]